MQYLEVAVASPIAGTLTYAAPQDSHVQLEPGLRLLAPLGNRQVTGYLLASVPEPQNSTFKIKQITDILDSEPLFPASMVPFYRWLADYYQYPIGEIIKSSLPGGLTPQSGRTITLTSHGHDFFSQFSIDDQPAHPWFEKFLKDKIISAGSARLIWKTKDRRLLEKWQDKGLVEINQTISSDAIKEKKEVCFKISTKNLEIEGLKKSENKSLDLLNKLSTETGQEWVARKDLSKEYKGSLTALPNLAKQGLVMMEEQTVYRDPFDLRAPFYPKPEHLTSEQQTAIDAIMPAIDSCKFTPFLLHGVTGSGKTEIYLHAAAHTIAKGRDVLVLVPEIALATQLEGNFLSRFGDHVALLHSGLSSGEKFDQWKRISRGQAKLVIGARSAIFAPLKDPGLIIIDEEHDGAFKQEDNFRYQARDSAVLRASQNNAVIILGSATPSITSYHNATTGKYKLLTMLKRVEDRPMPMVEIIDLKAIKTTSGRPPLFSPQLTSAMKENLIAGNQSLIFLNRRGYANLMLCRECGNSIHCRQCNITLTMHKKSKELNCHYCGYSIKSAALCPNCQSTDLVAVGFGTERLEEEISKLMPKARLGRLDLDTSSNRKNYMQILKAVHRREIDILIGTQMITKGLHFPHVTLVGVVWADAGLGIPDYKAGERTFQLLTQVLGRAGRGEKEGKVMVQTYHPSHYSITTAQSHAYESLFEQEIKLRSSLQYPPFSRLVNIRIEGKNEMSVKKAAHVLAHQANQTCRAKNSISVLGPAAAPLSKLRGLYRWQLMLKGSSMRELHSLSRKLVSHTSKAGMHGIKLSVDVDPENML